MDSEICYQILDDLGWFAGWPESARQSARNTIEANHEIRSQLNFSGVAMISVWGDSECVDEEDAYTRILNDFRSYSHGFFQPENIKEVWTDEGEGDFRIEVSFECSGKVYTGQIPYDGDWVNDAIFDLINEAMATCNPPMCFFLPDIGFGQEFGFLLIPTGLIATAIEQEILPPSEEIEDSKMEENDNGDPDSIRSFYELTVELDSPELFAHTWGELPEHLLFFVQRDLDSFIHAVGAGADINATSSNGILTPLRISANDNYMDGLEWLLGQPELKIDQVDQDGDTALSWAINKGFNEIAKRLISAGANIHLINNAGKNLVEFATEHGNEEMVAFLKEQEID